MNTAVVGMGFGDCGKGKIIDILCPDYDVVVRYAGGPNAGHTLVVDGKKTVFHHMPSSLLRNEATSILAAGMVVDPLTLADEIKKLPHEKPKLLIDKNIHCIMPWHLIKDRDECEENIGTTGRGIGPAYADKCMRVGTTKIESLALSMIFGTDKRLASFKHLSESYMDAFTVIEPYLADTGEFLREATRKKLYPWFVKDVLFEGAQGIFLDVDHGGYPYVTSCGVGPAAINQACGLPNLHIDRIVGVMKPYTTRVGEGPMKTELIKTETELGYADDIRRLGGEYGATTGRDRRIGWLNLDETKRAIALTGATEIALNHFDTISKFSGKIKVLSEGKYVEFEPWHAIDELAGQIFLRFIEKVLNRSIKIVGIGAGRDDVIFR